MFRAVLEMVGGRGNLSGPPATNAEEKALWGAELGGAMASLRAI